MGSCSTYDFLCTRMGRAASGRDPPCALEPRLKSAPQTPRSSAPRLRNSNTSSASHLQPGGPTRILSALVLPGPIRSPAQEPLDTKTDIRLHFARQWCQPPAQSYKSSVLRGEQGHLGAADHGDGGADFSHPRVALLRRTHSCKVGALPNPKRGAGCARSQSSRSNVFGCFTGRTVAAATGGPSSSMDMPMRISKAKLSLRPSCRHANKQAFFLSAVRMYFKRSCIKQSGY